nr:ankyrin repeat-containing protein BDA1-like [Ipomoea batatas]
MVEMKDEASRASSRSLWISSSEFTCQFSSNFFLTSAADSRSITVTGKDGGVRESENKAREKNPNSLKELNSKHSSPLHLAAAKGHVDVVRTILLVDPGMCKGRDRDGLTPVHLAAIKGRVDVLKELINAISISGLVDMMGVDDERLGESILHMCVKHSQLEALKIMVEMIGDRGEDFVNCRDAFGNTILHLVVTDNQIEILQWNPSSLSLGTKKRYLEGHEASVTSPNPSSVKQLQKWPTPPLPNSSGSSRKHRFPKENVPPPDPYTSPSTTRSVHAQFELKRVEHDQSRISHSQKTSDVKLKEMKD